MDSVEYNNVHGLHFSRTAYEAIEEFTGSLGIVWGITGCAGIQRYPASYCGDSRSTFSEMASVLRGGLSCAMSGIGLWGTDIGGFYDLWKSLSTFAIFSAACCCPSRNFTESERGNPRTMTRKKWRHYSHVCEYSVRWARGIRIARLAYLSQAGPR
jgi:alpha-glucosidase (family GH31 glycosyl hydrolase)